MTQLEKDWVDDCINRDPQSKCFVSYLYDTILTVASPSLNHIMSKLEEDLNLQIPDVTWKLATNILNTSSICVRHGLTQFKTFHRLHLSRGKLAKLYPNVDLRCVRCHQTKDTLGHMFWSWSRLRFFWLSIFDTISHVCKKRISPFPITAIFDTSPEGITLSEN